MGKLKTRKEEVSLPGRFVLPPFLMRARRHLLTSEARELLFERTWPITHRDFEFAFLEVDKELEVLEKKIEEQRHRNWLAFSTMLAAIEGMLIISYLPPALITVILAAVDVAILTIQQIRLQFEMCKVDEGEVPFFNSKLAHSAEMLRHMRAYLLDAVLERLEPGLPINQQGISPAVLRALGKKPARHPALPGKPITLVDAVNRLAQVLPPDKMQELDKAIQGLSAVLDKL